MPMNDHLDRETIRSNIERAQARRDAALAEYEAATAELKWWRAGQVLVEDDLASDPDRAADTLIAELIPKGFDTTQPSLRQALLLIMRSNPRKGWSIGDYKMMLALNNWLPQRADVNKRIADMAAIMVSERLLERAGRGVYELPEALASALERALPPITDYTVAGDLGFPVPDHPAAGPGLREDP